MPDVSKLLHETLQKVHLTEKAATNYVEKARPVSAKISHYPSPHLLDDPEGIICPPTDNTPSEPAGLTQKRADRTPAAEEDLHLSIAPLARVLVKNAIELACGVNDRLELIYFERTESCIRQMYPLLRRSLDVIFKAIHTAITNTAKGYRDAAPEKQRRAAEEFLFKAFAKLGELNFIGTEVYGQNLNEQLVIKVQLLFGLAVEQRKEGQRDWLLLAKPGLVVRDEFAYPRLSVVCA